MKCPSLIRILECLHGQLPAQECSDVLRHVSFECLNCRENYRWLEESLQLASEDHSCEYAEETIRHVLSFFKDRPGNYKRPISQLFAQLIFDSFSSHQLVGLRTGFESIATATERQMLFRFEGYDIDIRFEKNEGDDDEELIGQILSSDPPMGGLPNLKTLLYKGESEIDQTQTDGRGIFKFEQVPAGNYSIKIIVPEGELNIFEIATIRSDRNS